MSQTYQKISELEQMAAPSASTNVLVEENGQAKRIPANLFGGSNGGGSVEGAVLYTPQTLNANQQEQARTNIGAVATVNGNAPDENGNVEIETGGGSEDGAVLYAEQVLTAEQQAQARANIGAAKDNALPDYWQTHLAEKIATIRERQRVAGKDGYSFIVMADFHHPSNADYSPALIKRIAEACDIKYCLCLGDIQTGAAEPQKANIIKGWEEIHDIFDPIRAFTLFTAGNHDGAYGRYDVDGNGEVDATEDYYVYNFTREEIYDTIFRSVSKIPGVVFNDTGDAYYVDDTTAKVRYLLMNSHWAVYEEDENGVAVNNFMRKARFGQNQQDFALAALKSIPDDNWTVVVGCHMPIAPFPGDGGSHDIGLFRRMLEAFQNRTTFSETHGNPGDYDYVVIDTDFTDAKGRVVGAFAGHMHNDIIATEYAFPVMSIAADNYGSFKTNGLIAEPGELGTITEQSFNVMTVDKKADVIFATKIGKGSDQIISMGGSCLIDYVLDNAKVSNNAEYVLKNAEYTTAITPKVGYSLSTVTVTMGGEDITSTAYANGVVTISNVTGNIVITVTTELKFNNLVDLESEDTLIESHYLKDGVATKCNTSYEKTMIVTNFIPVIKEDVLRFKGIDTETGVQGSAAVFACYDENKNYLMSLKMDAGNLGKSAGLPTSVTPDGTGVYTYTILIRGDTNEQYAYKGHCDNVRYIRFSAHYTDTPENVIVTVNEEIV